MKYVLGLLFLIIALSHAPVSYAQTPESVASGSGSNQIQVTVPGVNLTVKGIVSPNASVALLSPDGTVYRGEVADSAGKFLIDNVLVAKGLSQFCIESVDVKRLGNSLACFPFDGNEKEETVDVFLPPTVGLQRQEIIEGTDAVVFGYSMPTAQVTVKLNTGATFSVPTDSSGYYEYTIPDLKVGSYQLVAGAYYESKYSAPSIRPVVLQTISLTQAIETHPLWFIIPVVLVIIGLLIYLFRERILVLFDKKAKKRLHHWWFIGY